MISTSKSLLPYDGEAIYVPSDSLDIPKKNWLFLLSESIDWAHDTVTMFGTTLTLKRKSAWYGNEGAHYRYSGIQRLPLPWITPLIELKEHCELIADTTFNSVLCNFYHDGNDGMGWHRDNEPELGINPIIVSMSFGAERTFSFKHRITKERVNLILEDGSILIMRGATQSAWMHSLPKRSKIYEPRINLTFRTILM